MLGPELPLLIKYSECLRIFHADIYNASIIIYLSYPQTFLTWTLDNSLSSNPIYFIPRLWQYYIGLRKAKVTTTD